MMWEEGWCPHGRWTREPWMCPANRSRVNMTADPWGLETRKWPGMTAFQRRSASQEECGLEGEVDGVQSRTQKVVLHNG